VVVALFAQPAIAFGQDIDTEAAQPDTGDALTNSLDSVIPPELLQRGLRRTDRAMARMLRVKPQMTVKIRKQNSKLSFNQSLTMHCYRGDHA
jgi:hypothetical protein